MYELHFRDTCTDSIDSPFTIARIAKAVDLGARLADRERLSPAELDAALSARAKAHTLASSGEGLLPTFPPNRLFPGAYYLEGVGPDGAREYGRRPQGDAAARARGGPLAPALARSSGSKEEEEEEEMTAAASSKTTASVTSKSEAEEGVVMNGAAAEKTAAVPGAGAVNGVRILSAGKESVVVLPRVVVTGVACGLPGQEKVFEGDNLARLLRGQGCVERLSGASKKALVEKNVVQVCSSSRSFVVPLLIVTLTPAEYVAENKRDMISFLLIVFLCSLFLFFISFYLSPHSFVVVVFPSPLSSSLLHLFRSLLFLFSPFFFSSLSLDM